MEIFTTKDTTLTKSGVLLITKSIGELIIGSTRDINSFTTEQISIEVEKIGGNLQITNGFMSLRDFILLTTFNADAVTSDPAYKTTAVCEICEDGAIQLADKDVIKIQLTGLISGQTYVVNALEMPSTSHKVLNFENKSMASDEKSKFFDVDACDLVLIDNSTTIEEIALTYLNGVTVRYTLWEVQVQSRAVDPVAYVQQDGKVTSAFPAKLQIPLFGVQQLEIRKEQGAVINLIQRLEAN